MKVRKRRAIVYARVSSKEQEKEGFSIPSQLKLLRDYANKEGFTIVNEYVDVETAKRAGRTGFDEMVGFLKEQPPGDAGCRTVLAEKTDRLYRNIRDWVTLDDLDLEVHFVKENCIVSADSRSSEKFVHGIKVLMAKQYVDNLGEETKKGMVEKAEEGIWPSFAPLGYRNVEGADGKKRIEVDPEMAPIVKRLFERYASGEYSLQDVTDMAGEEGLRYRKSGRALYASAIYRTLQKRIYYGEFDWDGKRYTGSHEPLVTRETYERVQGVLAEHRGRKRGLKARQWAFQGLVSCGHCGCALTPERKKGRYVYYHCTGSKGKCPEKYVREEELDRQFAEAVGAIRVDEDVLSWVLRALKESHGDERAYHDQMVAKLQRDYQRLQGRIDAMYLDKLDGKVDEDFFEGKSAEWREEQAQIRGQIERHEQANCAYLDEGARILELAQKATEIYEKRNTAEKRELLGLLLSNSTWRDGRLHPDYRKPFDMLAVTNAAYEEQKAAFPEKNGLCGIWYPLGDSNPCYQTENLAS